MTLDYLFIFYLVVGYQYVAYVGYELLQAHTTEMTIGTKGTV